MTIRLPEPIISEYYVRRLRFTANQMTGELEMTWDTPKFDVINTVEIEDVLRTPNTWLIGWGEIHYEVEARKASDGSIVDQPKELPTQVVHPFNMALIQALSERKLSPRQCRSWEAMLFNLGWKFKMKPVGENGSEEAFFPYPDNVKQHLLEQPEVQFLQKFASPEQAPQPIKNDSAYGFDQKVEVNRNNWAHTMQTSLADFAAPLQPPKQETEDSQLTTAIKELQLLQTQQLQLMTKILEQVSGAASNNGS